MCVRACACVWYWLCDKVLFVFSSIAIKLLRILQLVALLILYVYAYVIICVLTSLTHGAIDWYMICDCDSVWSCSYSILYRGSYMNDHVVLNLLNELGKSD